MADGRRPVRERLRRHDIALAIVAFIWVLPAVAITTGWLHMPQAPTDPPSSRVGAARPDRASFHQFVAVRRVGGAFDIPRGRPRNGTGASLR
jgi:hypothetical protein